MHLSDNGKEERQTRYYISDDDFPTAAYYGVLASGHRALKNGLHWYLDVTFRYDGCRAGRNNAAQNLSLLRKLAYRWRRPQTTGSTCVNVWSGHRWIKTI